MRFVLKCILTLAIVYRAILLSQGGSGAVALSSQVAAAVPAARARVRAAIADRVGAYCKDDPAACLVEAARLTRRVAPTAENPDAPRHSRQGAVAASTP